MDKKDKEIDRLTMLVQDKVFEKVYLCEKMKEAKDLLELTLGVVKKHSKGKGSFGEE